MFTTEDDEILVDWAEIGRERGLALLSERHWQELADKVISPVCTEPPLIDVVSASQYEIVEGPLSKPFQKSLVK